jgi:hypothetical protein
MLVSGINPGTRDSDLPQSGLIVRNIISILPQLIDLQRNDGCQPEVAITSHSQHNCFPPVIVHSRFESQAFIRFILQVSDYFPSLFNKACGCHSLRLSCSPIFTPLGLQNETFAALADLQ